MSNPELRASLVIPAYNEEKYIGECLSHVQKNALGKFFEIIVIDNASTDSTAEIAKKFQEVRIVRENNKGLTHARERGFQEAKGDIIAYIDADTQMPPGWFEILEREFYKNPELAILSGPYIYYDLARFQKAFVKFYFFFARPFYNLFGYMIIGGNFAIKRKVLEKMRGFDTSISFYGEDTDIAKRAHKFGKVKFETKFFMPTSARRLKNQGLIRIAILYVINFFWVAIFGKPITKKYVDIR